MPISPPAMLSSDGLGQELPEDVAPPRPDREPDADLARALGHGHEHDVHDADAADQQGDAGDGAKQQRHASWPSRWRTR